MSKLRRGKILRMTSLYLEFVFQKSTLIIFLLSFIIMGVAIYFLGGSNLDPLDYIEGYSTIHSDYLSSGIIIIELFNAIIITSLIIVLTIQARDFDKLFITTVKRSSIQAAKILTILIIILISAIIEWLILIGIAYFQFSKFYISYKRLIEIIYIFLPAFLFSMLAYAMTVLFPLIFTPFVMLIINAIYIFMFELNKKIDLTKNDFLSVLYVNNSFLVYSNYIYAIAIIIFLIIISISIYSIKDLK